jgi:hypothetical protein
MEVIPALCGDAALDHTEIVPFLYGLPQVFMGLFPGSRHYGLMVLDAQYLEYYLVHLWVGGVNERFRAPQALH